MFYCVFLSLSLLSPCVSLCLSLAADPERGVDDGPERSCSGLYIWRCHVRFGGAAKPGDASESQQLSLSRAQAHRVCGLTGLPAQGVGDLTQLPKGLHIAREFTSGHILRFLAPLCFF